MTQTLAVGQTIASQYGKWGIANRRMVPPPGRIFGAVVGKPGVGKTNLFTYNPAALILNLDASSTPTPSQNAPPPTAQFYPGFNDIGQTIDANDQPFIMDWQKVEDIKASLITAALENRPRPQTVVLDSTSTAISMLTRWIVKKEQDKQKGREGGKKINGWGDLHGEAAWSLLYNTLLDFAADLRPYYGVWYVLHVSDKKVEEGEVTRIKSELTTPPGFLPRFYPLFEMVLGVEKQFVPVIEEKKQIIQLGGGQTTEVVDKITSLVAKTVLVGETQEMASVYKRRIAFPVRMDVPGVNGWQVFEEAYKKAALPPTN